MFKKYIHRHFIPSNKILSIYYAMFLIMSSRKFIIFIYFQTILAPIAHNVPAVCDVFAARIRALRSKDQGCKNVAEFWRGNGAKRNDLAKT
jgi:hypothetical protein